MDLYEKPIIEIPSTEPPTELAIEDQIIGEGSECSNGQLINVDYVGAAWSNGTEFDSSWSRNEVFSFSLGIGQVIAGWDEGIQLLKVGDKARFVIPSNLAYGESGAGGVIPPNATLIFDVELMDVK